MAVIGKIEYYRKDTKGVAELGAAEAILQTLIKVHAQAVALCPVDYGQLKNSIMFTFEDAGLKFNENGGSEKAPSDQKISTPVKRLTGYVGTNSDHWYPEFGTRYQVAQPFLRPAGEIAKGAEASKVAAKYCREKMVHEFNQRKYERLFSV